MNKPMSRLMPLTVTFIAGLLVVCGCEKKEPPAPETPPSAPLAESAKPLPPVQNTDELPAGHPSIGQPATPARQDGLPSGHPPIKPSVAGKNAEAAAPVEATTQFAGISLTPPEGWQAFDASGGMMAPVAAFILPGENGESSEGGEDTNASARLTHFPNMKQIPIEQNLQRWYGQVQQPSGNATKDVAKVETFEVGAVKITMVDMTGTIDGHADYRMIAAQIDHAQGPHFLKVIGPANTVAKWHDSVVQYLKSAQVTP